MAVVVVVVVVADVGVVVVIIVEAAADGYKVTLAGVFVHCCLQRCYFCYC